MDGTIHPVKFSESDARRLETGKTLRVNFARCDGKPCDLKQFHLFRCTFGDYFSVERTIVLTCVYVYNELF